jgi:prepilin-type N-terminal cleavage/methylation domain-containing protein
MLSLSTPCARALPRIQRKTTVTKPHLHRLQSPRAGHRRRDGFTLTEMLFVLIIVGIMATMMTPLFQPGRWRADTAAQEMAMTLNATQRLAVLRQHDIVVTFDEADRSLRILHDMNNDGVADTGEETHTIDLPETIGFGTAGAPALGPGTGPITFASGEDDPTLTFHRNGSASSSGIIYLRPLVGSVSESAEGVRALSIERATGEIRCFSYRTGSWEESC